MGVKKIKSIFSSRVLAIIFSAGLLLFPVSSQAAYLDFVIGPNHPEGASISYGGNGGSLIGTNISVYSVTGIGTPENDGDVMDIDNGILSFTSGNYFGGGSNYWQFGPGGTITLTGDIGEGSVPLFSGTFNIAIVGAMPVPKLPIYFGIVVGSMEDYKNTDLLNYYGLPDWPYAGNMNLSFYGAGTPTPPDAFTSLYVLSGNIVNTPIPIPTTLLLLASGVLGLIGLSRKLKNRTI